MLKNIAVIRSGGDIGTAIAHKLLRCGFKVLILEKASPLAIRRTVSFSEAIFDGETEVEGIKAVKVHEIDGIIGAWADNNVPIMVDETGSIIKEIPVDIVVDAILAKKNLGTYRGMAPITIGVGPGFQAGIDVDVVIETNRGHDLGRLIFQGSAEADTGIPGVIMGFGKERVIKAPCDGKIKIIKDIGETVCKEEVIAYIDKTPIKATIDGVVRGMIKEFTSIKTGLKIADIDPRGKLDHCYTMSDKARAIAGGVLEAILHIKHKKNIEL
ncbi:selenium-dependent molybdenum cofactor biosynthesis protein YqeB [Natronincola ferrireducens]|uniref:Xanthine dehydrogenase accessory factor n=1 Tax=Natronincola ferrireducens TaxID=393762 RepID=A0A1G9HCU4_9FIRM|nr:selenium-dependent molybdenum cofactor biosynthesis protein YqeB [Natronincola ferrireducens]SDL10646.1 xanthine dehydrogenase accessory factor [Natronincola ferrireducens]